jgi:hypothetical protein
MYSLEKALPLAIYGDSKSAPLTFWNSQACLKSLVWRTSGILTFKLLFLYNLSLVSFNNDEKVAL